MDSRPEDSREPRTRSEGGELGQVPEGGVPPTPWDIAEQTLKEPELSAHDDAFRRQVGAKQARKVLRRKEGEGSIWFGIGMFGVVGWSVAIPTVIGIGLGYLIDRSAPGRISWTLTLLVIGLCLGCLNAWYWVTRQRRAIEQRQAELEAQEKELEELAKARERASTGGRRPPSAGSGGSAAGE